MKTAIDMYEFCVKHGFCSQKTPKYIRSFEYIIDSCLEKDEHILLPLTLTSYYNNGLPLLDGGYTVAVFTNKKRIISCNRGLFTGKPKATATTVYAAQNIEMIRSRSLSTPFDRIEIDIIRNKPGFANTTSCVDAMFPFVLELFHQYQKQETIHETVSTADELLKFKNLYDMGIITQEEFEAKKKQLLGL